MNPFNTVLFFLSAAVVTTAVPLSDLDKELEALVQVLNGLEEKAWIQTTGCSTRSHKLYYDIGSRTYIFRYRACFNHLTHLMCYDSRETLPRLCPPSFRGEDCNEIQWRIHGNTTQFEICDKFGVPCQKPIPGLWRSDSNGQCNSYHRHPPTELQPRPSPRPQLPHPHICQDINIAEEMDDLDDCFCVTKGRNKVCHGENCHVLAISKGRRV